VILLVDSKETLEVVQAFVEEFGITHPVLLDQDGAVSKLYQILAIPTEIFIDQDGMIRAKIVETVTPQRLAEKPSLIGIDP
jgi:peroxiredoxin